MLNKEQAQAVADQYPGLPAVERTHMLGRLRWCQYDEIADLLPSQGDILDIGCGYGHFAVYLTGRAPGVVVHGCDPDQRKIAVARQARASDRRFFHAGDCRSIDSLDRSYQGVVILDVLYLMPLALQDSLLAWAAQRLAPGGVLVIKTIDPGQGLKSRLANLQEWVMVRLLGKTYSSGAHAAGREPEYYLAKLAAWGVECRVIPLPENRTPSVLITGAKK